jgi:quercetin dioxygenase-like cupin family protein
LVISLFFYGLPAKAKTLKETSMTVINHKADLKTVAGSADTFTGDVSVTMLFQREAPSRVSGARVHFEPGARTAWHTHPLGQTLIVTEGVGWTQVEGGPTLEFQAGEVLLCPANERHWHGATPTQGMTHIAVQESENGSPVTWMEHVSDADYLKGPDR